jgi:hypothetical protein
MRMGSTAAFAVMVLWSTAAAPPNAKATVITFDDLTPRASDQMPRPYHGFIFSASPYDGILESAASTMAGVHNGAVSSPNVLLSSGQANSIQPWDWEDGAVFTFNSGYFTSAVDSTMVVQALGFTPEDRIGPKFETTFLINNLGPTYVSLDWNGLSEIELTGMPGRFSTNNQFVMDDLTVNVNTEAPEPATSALVVVGVVMGLLGRARRRPEPRSVCPSNASPTN